MTAKSTAPAFAAALFSIAAAASDDISSEKPKLTALESLQVTGLLSGMAVVEQRLEPRSCIRYTACVAGVDPSPAVRVYIHAAGYRAVRWCSRPAVTVPSHCKRATINVLAPVSLAEPVQLVFETSGAVGLRCKVPVEGGAGQYWPTTARFCSDDKQ